MALVVATVSGLARLGATGDLQELNLPSGVAPLAERPSFCQIKRGSTARLFIDGGFNENLLVTDSWNVLRRTIQPMSETLVESASPTAGQIGIEKVSASTGLSGSVIVYLRWYDSLNNRRSPFSAASSTLTLTGVHKLTFRNVPARPIPDDTPVDKVEVWISRNGGAIRRLATRDAGVSTFTVTETIEYEAETVEGLQMEPRTRYNAIYHERRWTAGDQNAPDRVYYSPLERLSDFAGGYLSTRNGEAVVGIATVRDVLVVVCAHSSYYIAGYSEDDFEMRVLEPAIGAITHHGIKMVHDVALIPSHKGLYACTGTSMSFIAGDYTTLWSEMYTQDPLAFELGFAVNDERGKVYKFFMEDVNVTDGTPTYGNGRYWVFDYRNFSQAEGGGYAQPYLSFDTHAARPKCAAMVSAPGGRAGNLYTAFTGIATGDENRIVAENAWSATDQVGDFRTVIQPAPVGAEPEGGPNDGIEAIQGWLLVQLRSKTSWFLEMTHGPERSAIRNMYSWAANRMFGVPIAAAPEYGGGRKIIPDWPADIVAVENTFTPAALPFKAGLVGECFSILLSVLNPVGLVWSGWGITIGPGKKYLAKDGTPEITEQPGSVTISSGDATTLEVAADGEDLVYAWYEGESGDTSAPTGETGASFETDALTSTTSYWVRVSNDSGTVDSDAAVVTVS